MSSPKGFESHHLLLKVRDVLEQTAEGQDRLDRVVELIASSMSTEVCSIYLRHENNDFELSSTIGLKQESVHTTVMRAGEGLVGRIGETRKIINTSDAQNERGFRYFPETGEELYHSFLGVPIQRFRQLIGVLVVQSAQPRVFSQTEVNALEVIAMVLAEMTELGAFSSGERAAIRRPHQLPFAIRGLVVQEGVADGVVFLHNPQVTIQNPVADEPEVEKTRLIDALETLSEQMGQLVDEHDDEEDARDILETFLSFSRDKGFRRRLIEDIDNGLSAEAAVEIEITRMRNRMRNVTDVYIRERLVDLENFCYRILRILSGIEAPSKADLPENAVLIASDIGPAELLEYGRALKAVILEKGSVGSHAAIVARAFAIPLIIQTGNITTEAIAGDRVLVDGEQGIVHLRPEAAVIDAFGNKIAMNKEAQERYQNLRNLPAITKCGAVISLQMNAGLIAELPSLVPSGADGVGLFRTELQFLTRRTVPKRGELAKMYERILDSAGGKAVTFRTLDIGSDKILPYMKRDPEPNPALGWRAIRVGLDRKNILKMQLQALIRGANGRPLRIMFPFIAQYEEFQEAKHIFLDLLAHTEAVGQPVPSHYEVGAMLETPSLAFAPDRFFQETDFISIGGNDLKQFFFAADRENERVRKRYDTLNSSFLSFINLITERCAEHNTPVSFCGEDAGRPLEAVAFAAMGLRTLSMRPASIGPVKAMLRQVDLNEVKHIIGASRARGTQNARPELAAYLASFTPQSFDI